MDNDLSPFPAEEKEKKEARAIPVRTIVIALAIIIVGGLAYYYKSVVVAATVNGSPVSRLALIRELEKSSGKKTLDSLIDEKLIKGEIADKNVSVTDAEIDEEIKKIEAQVAGQQANLAQLLEAQGVTHDEFKERIKVQKQIEKLLSDKLAILDEEVNKYIADNKLTAPAGQEAQHKEEIRYQLRAQKFSAEAQKWITDLRAKARVRYFVNY